LDCSVQPGAISTLTSDCAAIILDYLKVIPGPIVHAYILDLLAYMLVQHNSSLVTARVPP
jgi:hypothetical protein